LKISEFSLDDKFIELGFSEIFFLNAPGALVESEIAAVRVLCSKVKDFLTNIIVAI